MWVLQIHLQLDHPAAGFIRAAGHPNCPGASDFRARETQSRRGWGWGGGGGGAKATCGASHASGVIHLDRDTISSTCSLSTSASWKDTPSLFPGGVFFGTGGGPWCQMGRARTI